MARDVVEVQFIRNGDATKLGTPSAKTASFDSTALGQASPAGSDWLELGAAAVVMAS
jgi:hypothetical protein